MSTVVCPVDEAHALHLDAVDPLPARRADFHVPPTTAGGYAEVAYLAGNSLGLQPRATRAALEQELADWARLGVEGHLEAGRPWKPYHELLRDPAARLVGALPAETVVMNSLTVDLHLMMTSFYRPTPERYAIVVEDSTFPSDSYAVQSQARLHGLDPAEAVVRLRPRPGEDCLRTEDVLGFLRREGHRVALVLFGGVNYLTGELMDVPAITAAGRAAGAVVGWDLAHAVGNVPLRLHEWGVDWAAWCHYKYVNGGPGAVAGCFVHERHIADRTLPKLQGWWSTDPATRFAMGPDVAPVDTADSWQLSNPPILAMAPVLVSLRMFDEVGMEALRDRSVRLTGYLADLLATACADVSARVITPADPRRRGCQLSVRITRTPAEEVCARLRHEHGVIADARPPDVVRFAPVPLYCTHHDAWRAATALAAVLSSGPLSSGSGETHDA
ncbi:kynureninase [Pseudonocardia sp. RS11V-5]|uniref:kynureninase n=1 Tax=Pseudonocardia terrae TaxID=2905831 RepID=UPI001E2A0DFD|nr:kynureninase [Pseudonocardia terrae]MCE3554138.1 kynureninase [Pseudonocardia terrae]